MTFAIKLTQQFRNDLEALRDNPEIETQLKQVYEVLEEDPRKHQGSLHSAVLKRIGDRIFKSRLTSGYRFLWSYGTDHDIILARIGPHDFINDQATVSDLRVAAVVQRPRPASPSAASGGIPPRPPAYDNPAIFGRVPQNTLQLLGVPETHIRRVQEMTDLNKISDIGLPEHTCETLLDLATRNECDLAELLFDKRVLFRATADQLAGYCRGELKQLLLNLTPEQEQYVTIRARGPVLIKGVAGSGKTTVGLRKAMEERSGMGFYASQLRVMFTTFTETLARSVQQMFVEQYGQAMASQVEVCVLRDHLKSILGAPVVGKEYQLKGCLGTAIAAAKHTSPDSAIWRIRDFQQFLKAEIENVIKGRNLKTFDEYAAVKRPGRHMGLQRPARQVVWHVFEAYQAELAKKGIIDYLDVAVQAHAKLDTVPADDLYNVVIVDEAQDLRPIELQVLRKMCRNRTGAGLILLGDAAQTLYYRGVSWTDAGINIKGRTYELRRNFRNTRQILDAAWSLINADKEAAESLGPELIVPDQTRKSGPLPTILRRGTITDQQTAVVKEILRLCQQASVRPGDIAILAPNKDLVNNLRARLIRDKIPCVHYKDDDFDLFENSVKLITLHSSKGLEFPVVFVTSLTEGELPRASSTETTGEPDEPTPTTRTLNDRQLLYVAMTRAAQRLYLVGDTSKPSRFLAEIDQAKVVVG